MSRILQSHWMVSLIGCLAYLATTVALLQPGKLQGARRPVEEAKGAPALGPSWNYRNPEIDQMVAELKTQKDELDQREQGLKELELRLQAEHQEILSVTQTVSRLQQEFDANVIRLKEAETANLKKLAKLHADMAPESSARILKELSDDDAAKILAYMKVDEASAVLEAFTKLGKDDAKRAALLSERLRQVVPPAPGNTAAPTP